MLLPCVNIKIKRYVHIQVISDHYGVVLVPGNRPGIIQNLKLNFSSYLQRMYFLLQQVQDGFGHRTDRACFRQMWTASPWEHLV